MVVAPPMHHSSEQILCCYANRSELSQTVRITNVPERFFERVVFPGQSILFETHPDALVEVHTFTANDTAVKVDVACDRLRVDETMISKLLSQLA